MRLKVILVFVLLASAISAYADELPELEDVVEKTMPAIVTVTTYKNPEQDLSEDSTIEIPKSLRHLFEAKEKSTVIDQTGTGFFISKNGYVITCLHIVSNAEKIQVSLYDKRKFSANIIARDNSLDLALLKVEGDSFSVLDFETIKPLRIGAWVFVIGAPYGFDFSANVGIVSSNSRVLPTGDGSTHYIQTSIPINPGHSGSPVVNLSGKVVGVTSYIFTDQPGSIGISFALPAFQVEQISKKWIGRSNVN
jgi:serine protease Do